MTKNPSDQIKIKVKFDLRKSWQNYLARLKEQPRNKTYKITVIVLILAILIPVFALLANFNPTVGSFVKSIPSVLNPKRGVSVDFEKGTYVYGKTDKLAEITINIKNDNTTDFWFYQLDLYMYDQLGNMYFREREDTNDYNQKGLYKVGAGQSRQVTMSYRLPWDSFVSSFYFHNDKLGPVKVGLGGFTERNAELRSVTPIVIVTPKVEEEITRGTSLYESERFEVYTKVTDFTKFGDSIYRKEFELKEAGAVIDLPEGASFYYSGDDVQLSKPGVEDYRPQLDCYKIDKVTTKPNDVLTSCEYFQINVGFKSPTALVDYNDYFRLYVDSYPVFFGDYSSGASVIELSGDDSPAGIRSLVVNDTDGGQDFMSIIPLYNGRTIVATYRMDGGEVIGGQTALKFMQSIFASINTK